MKSVGINLSGTKIGARLFANDRNLAQRQRVETAYVTCHKIAFTPPSSFFDQVPGNEII